MQDEMNHKPKHKAPQVRKNGSRAGGTGHGARGRKDGRRAVSAQDKAHEITYLCYLLIACRDAGDDLDLDPDLIEIRGMIRALLWDRDRAVVGANPDDYEEGDSLPPDPDGCKENATQSERWRARVVASQNLERFWLIVEDEAAKYIPRFDDGDLMSMLGSGMTGKHQE